MATGSYMTPIYSRSQSEVQGDPFTTYTGMGTSKQSSPLAGLIKTPRHTGEHRFIGETETSRNITARVIERDTSRYLLHSRRFQRVPNSPTWSPMTPKRLPTWSPKMMPTWLYRQDFAKFSLNRNYKDEPGHILEHPQRVSAEGVERDNGIRL
ncbi:hypothetical protein TNCV_45441 [Trichonephila clavipes]|nr:hypothetical protein TNCV_45441 [Trichonephila clavipes]